MSDAPVSDNSSPAPPPLPRPRWWLAIVLLIFGVASQLWIWLMWTPDRTMQTMFAYLYGLPTIMALGVWWLLLSRLPWRTRLRGVALMAVGLLVLAGMVRIDSFTGEVFPILNWRWAPHREDISAAYFANHPAGAKAATSKPAAGETATQLVVSEADWPGYRGPRRDGIVRHSPIRTDWPTQLPQQLWRHPIGLGWSAFAVVDGLAFTQEQRREYEVIACYDAFTGEQIWVHQDTARFSERLGGDGPRGTPTIVDGRLYAAGATGILNCLDARSGKKIWSHDVLVENSIGNLPWGMTGSPLVVDDIVAVNAGGTQQKGVLAFHRVTGQPVWNAGVEPASYSSLQVNEVDGVRQILLFDGLGIAGLDLKSGRQLWRFPWSNSPKVNGAQPIVPASNQVLISNGYGVGSVLLQVEHQQEHWTATPVWESKRLRMKFNSGVLLEDHVYGLDEGILACLDVRTGKLKWKGGRYSFGQLLLVEKSLVILAESGEVALVDAIPDRFNEVARFQAINGKTWNCPAIWKGLLFVRNGDEAACYDVRPRQ